MSKRILISVVLLVLALCLSVTSCALLQNRVSKLGRALENAVYTNLPADESCAAVEACAAESLPWLRVLVTHSALSPLTEQLDALPLVRHDAEAYRQACLRCLALLRDIRDDQKATWDNILRCSRIFVG